MAGGAFGTVEEVGDAPEAEGGAGGIAMHGGRAGGCAEEGDAEFVVVLGGGVGEAGAEVGC